MASKRKTNYKPEIVWVFAWNTDATGKPGTGILLTHITAHSRERCKDKAVDWLGPNWHNIAKDGGECVRCIVKPAKKGARRG